MVTFSYVLIVGQKINHDMIQTDLHALATNPTGHIFAATYFWGRSFPIDRQWRQVDPGNNGLECAATFGLSRSIRSELSLPEQQDAEQASIAPTDNGDSWALANIGLTSTDVAALAVKGSNYHVFAGTHSIMGKGGGMLSIH